MKARLLMGMGALFLLMVASSAFGQAGPPLVTVDENGHGNFLGNPLPAQFTPDPLNPGKAPLTYMLPFPVLPGDVIITEPNASANAPSDFLRFTNIPGGPGELLFYSDFVEAGEVPDLADIGIPAVAQTNVFTIPEVGLEPGPNGAIYTPTPNQPGFALGTIPVAYNIISDAVVPEPVSALSMSTVGICFLLNRHRRS